MHGVAIRGRHRPTECGHVELAESDRAVGGCEEAEHGAPERGLARPRFADETDRLADADGQARVLDSAYVGESLPRKLTATPGEDDGEPVDVEQRFAHERTPASSSSPSRTQRLDPDRLAASSTGPCRQASTA